jgi:hypothetical protein
MQQWFLPISIQIDMRARCSGAIYISLSSFFMPGSFWGACGTECWLQGWSNVTAWHGMFGFLHGGLWEFSAPAHLQLWSLITANLFM